MKDRPKGAIFFCGSGSWTRTNVLNSMFHITGRSVGTGPGADDPSRDPVSFLYQGAENVYQKTLLE